MKPICKNCIALPICNKRSYIDRIKKCSILESKIIDKIVTMDATKLTISSPKKLRIREGRNFQTFDVHIGFMSVNNKFNKDVYIAECQVEDLWTDEVYTYTVSSHRYLLYKKPVTLMRYLTIL